MLIGGLGLEPTSIWITVAGLIAVISQATLLGVVTLWIATRQSRVGRVIGGLILAVLSMALTYGMIFGPMWKINVLNVATITLTWILGRQKRVLARPETLRLSHLIELRNDPAEEGFWIRRCRLQSRVARFSRNLGLDEIFGMCAS